MSGYTTQHIPVSSGDRKLKDNIMELEHFLGPRSISVCVCFAAKREEQSELWEMSGNLVRMECQGYRGYRGILPVTPPSSLNCSGSQPLSLTSGSLLSFPNVEREQQSQKKSYKCASESALKQADVMM